MVLASIGVVMLRRRGNGNVPMQVESLPATTTLYIEVERATQGFDQCYLLGCGGFGSVYKGTFANEMTLSIEVFNLQIEGAFKSFYTECDVLRNLRHRNLIKVISSCTNIDFKALLQEYMPNGSLDQCDLKPRNVLPDERLVGLVSDFGRTKLLGEGESIAHTKTLATLGYIAPEYGSLGLVSTKFDVYSYCILLMEAFTSKKPYDEMFQENLTMRSWVCSSTPEDITDATLLKPEEIEFNKMLCCASSVVELALNFTSGSPNERMNMNDVLEITKKIKLEFTNNGARISLATVLLRGMHSHKHKHRSISSSFLKVSITLDSSHPLPKTDLLKLQFVIGLDSFTALAIIE
ncbi:hypothetical protein CQW23_21285 [Capsicum baccatum]|uniref:Protein kinase domain-containing protein n=1 Tax=Capsicum baccatum TaxID=33114 RepID=A0A2G2VXK6_CAPBA|nr:hypothetical protein CQW23_21285 [Capsicum baccatum]